MPVLENEQHESFCREYVKNRNATTSYAKAFGCTIESADANQHRVMGYEGVKQRINELSERITEKVVKTQADALEWLESLVWTPPAEITEHSPLCNGIKPTKFGDQVLIPDKLGGMKVYAGMRGWILEKSDGGVMININLLGADLPMKQVVDIESQEG